MQPQRHGSYRRKTGPSAAAAASFSARQAAVQRANMPYLASHGLDQTHQRPGIGATPGSILERPVVGAAEPTRLVLRMLGRSA